MPRLAIALCALLMFIITPSVKADTVILDGGQFFIDGLSASPHYTIHGIDFSVNASGGTPGNTVSCNPCVSGIPISISSSFTGTSLGSGSATINGTTFNNIGFLGDFNFVVGDVILPVLPDGLIGVQFEVPFTFTGNIRGCSPSNVNCTTEVFSTTQLIGEGIAKAAFTVLRNENGQTLYTFTSLRYDFRPVPEPVTLTLLASGLVGLGVKLRKRRKIR